MEERLCAKEYDREEGILDLRGMWQDILGGKSLEEYEREVKSVKITFYLL